MSICTKNEDKRIVLHHGIEYDQQIQNGTYICIHTIDLKVKYIIAIRTYVL